MPRRTEIPDPDSLYDSVTRPGTSPTRVRQGILRLGRILGDHCRNTLPPDAAVLGVVILRGGLLLYPGFAEAFPEMDFCLLAMERDHEGRAQCRYQTRTPHREHDTAILIDCVAATGGTLLAARQVLAAERSIPAFQAATLCSSKLATATLLDEGFDVLGFRLDEGLDGDIVTPDLGELDAGDLVGGVPAGWGSGSTAG
jgi:uracil phosphoribosyltransferase